MSYCRWSSMNWMCDVYVYEGCGFVTHVAGRRRVCPPIPDFFERHVGAVGAWAGGVFDKETRLVTYPSRFRERVLKAYCRLWSFWHNYVHLPTLQYIPLRDIGLPCDGRTYADETPGACAARLEGLRAMGYNVPQRAIDRLREEEGERG